MLEEAAQLETAQISGLEGLAQLIATVYQGVEEKLERLISVPRGFSTKDWVHDHLEELERSGEPAAIRRFIGQLSRIDRIAEQIAIDIDEIPHDRKPSEILKRLGILEYNAPIGIYTDLDRIESITSECQKIHKYHDLLGHGVDVCKVIEHMLKLLVLFYGEFCFPKVFSQDLHSNLDGQADLTDVCNKTISDSRIKRSLRNFAERKMDVDLGTIIELLRKLDEYTRSLTRFQQSFGRYSIFSQLAPNSTSLQDLTAPSLRLRRSRIETAQEIQAVLDEIKSLRNDLPHDKSMNPEKSELQKVEGLRSHLNKLFDALDRFKQYGEHLRLFPSLGVLTQKFERINLGPRLELVPEDGSRVFIPCQSLADYTVGAEYFFRQGLGLRKSERVLALKHVPLGG